MAESPETYEVGTMGSQYIPAQPKPPPKSTPSGMLMEPVLAGSMMAIFLAQTSLQNLYLRTACSVDLELPRQVCETGVGEAFQQAEIASQKLVSHVNISRGFVGALISTVILLFLGPWSDCSRRRKPLIIISLLGMCVSTINVLIIITFPVFSSLWVLYMVQIPMSVGGNFALLLAAGFSYIGDVCNGKGYSVTMTMGRHRAVVQAASVVGSVAGPLLYRHFGFYGVFPIVFSLQASALLYALFRVEDIDVNQDNQVSVLSPRLPLSAARCLLREREKSKRAVVLMMVVVALAERAILSAEVSLLYMYLRNKYRWDDIMFGSYFAYRNIVSFVGTLVILRVLKAKLNASDATVGVLSGVSLICSEVFLVASTHNYLVFMVPVVAFIGQGSQVVTKPILNKQIKTDEQGKIYSFVSALEQACQMAVSPSFSLLYNQTADVFPDAWLLPCIVFACISTAAFTYARRLLNKEEMDTNKDKEIAPFINSINKEDNEVNMVKDGVVIVKEEKENEFEKPYSDLSKNGMVDEVTGQEDKSRSEF